MLSATTVRGGVRVRDHSCPFWEGGVHTSSWTSPVMNHVSKKAVPMSAVGSKNSSCTHGNESSLCSQCFLLDHPQRGQADPTAALTGEQNQWSFPTKSKKSYSSHISFMVESKEVREGPTAFLIFSLPVTRVKDRALCTLGKNFPSLHSAQILIKS